MRSILKATAILGSASVVSILMGLVSAKVSAVLLGPVGVGQMGLLQSLLGLTAMIAGMGIGTGLVREGARAIAEKDERRLAALRRGAWLMCGALGGASAIVMALARTPLSTFVVGTAGHGAAIALVAVGLLLTLAAAVQIGILNAHHRVGALARSSVATSILGVSLSLLIIWWWRSAGIPWAVVANCLVAWAVSAYFLRRFEPRPKLEVSWQEVVKEARGLVRFGAPYTASLLVGAGVLMAMPVLVLHAFDAESVGFYRAAATISISYLGFVITSMAQDYYPRVSAVADRSDDLCRLVNEQHRLILLLGGPIILGMLALVPYLVPLIYSPKFAPAVELLEWQLLGDILRFAGWTMAFVILARSGSLTYFGVELVGGLSLLLFSWLGSRWLGLEGIGVGFVVCAGIGYLLCWIILRRSIGLRWTTQNIVLLWTLVVMAFIIRGLPYLDMMSARTPVALVLAALAGAYSLYTLWGEVGGSRGLLGALRGRARSGTSLSTGPVLDDGTASATGSISTLP